MKLTFTNLEALAELLETLDYDVRNMREVTSFAIMRDNHDVGQNASTRKSFNTHKALLAQSCRRILDQLER